MGMMKHLAKGAALFLLGVLVAAAARRRRARRPRASRISPMSRACGATCSSATAWSSASTAPATRSTTRRSPSRACSAMLERLGVNTRGDSGLEHQERRRRDGDGEAAALRRARARASTCRSRRWATPRACRAARCWSRRCSAPTARSMPWPRARSASAASPPRARPPRVTKGVPTSGPHRQRRASSSARSAYDAGERADRCALALRNPDLTTARRIAQAINALSWARRRRSRTIPTTVRVDVPGRLCRRRRGHC